jgi:predicted ATPase
MIEGERHFAGAIELLRDLPEDVERDRLELKLQLAVGPALIAVKGWATSEAERTYTRARQLCNRLGDSPELFPVLFGMWAIYLDRGDFKMASELAEQLLRVQGAHDPALLAYSRLARGVTSFWMGKFLPAEEYLESAITLYDPERNRPLIYSYGYDAGVAGLSYAAWTLWLLGYADQALKRSYEALALAQRLSHPLNLAHAELFVGVLRQYRREVRAAQENADSVIAHTAEHGLSDYWAWATGLRGWAMAQQGRSEEGIEQLQQGLAGFSTTEALLRPYFLCLLAEVCIETGRLDDGLTALTEALAVADELDLRFYEAETHRLNGELLLKQDAANAATAERCFRRAIEIARIQSAKSLELRATVSLARFLRNTARSDEARTILGEIYGGFTEGLDTSALVEAKNVLDELDGRSNASRRSNRSQRDR